MTKLRRYKTSYLFPRSSMLHGFGSIFNIAGNYFEFNYSNSGNESDKKAIENDWGVIGDDIREATVALQNELLQITD